MPRPQPVESDELLYLRTVVKTKEGEGNPNDVSLANYRKRMKENPEWVHEQLRIAEREHRKELADWHKEVLAEKKAVKAEVEVKQQGKVKDIGTERCLAKLDKLIAELTKS